MIELWEHAISPINLPFTALLALVICYWGLVIFGFLEMDHGHVDVNAGLGGGDMDGNVHVGMDADVGASVDAGVDGNVDAHADGNLHAEHPGLVSGFLQFLHMGEMPFMIVVSILSVTLWAGSMLLNYYYNPGAILATALLIFVPLLVGAVIVTHFAALPLKKMYQLMEKDYDTHKSVIGQVGKVVTTEVTSTFGQIEIIRSGAPVTLNARTAEGKTLNKGEEALVTALSGDKKTFSVIKYEQPKLEE